jgi:hypothetical protein
MIMATKNSTETGNNAPDDDIKRMGQTILRAKTVLIKPYSKVKILIKKQIYYSFFKSFSILKKVFVREHLINLIRV